MMSLPGFRTGIRLVTAFSTIAGAFYPSGCIRAPANYAPQFRPHLHNMAGSYSHIVSIAPYLSRILMDEQVNAIWKLLEVRQLNANYVQTKL